MKSSRNEGKDYKGDIYSGVYDALQGLYQVEYDNDKILGDSALNQYYNPVKRTEANTEIAVRSVVYSRDGKSFYSAGSNGEVLKWDVKTRKSTRIFKSADVEVARVVNISPDEKYIALGTQDDNILIFNANRTNAEPVKISGHKGGTVYDLVFLPDNSGFISVGGDNRILRSDFRNTEEIARVSSRVKTLALSPDAKVLVAGSDDGKVYKWELYNLEQGPSEIVRKSTAPVTSVRFSNQGRFLAMGDEDGVIIVYIFGFNQQHGPNLTGFRAPVTDIEFSPDNKLLVATSKNSQTRVWDMENIYELPTVLNDYPGENQAGWVYDASFSPDGEHFVTAAGDGKIRRYPALAHGMADELCGHLSRGMMTKDEWKQYVFNVEKDASDEIKKKFAIRETCKDK